ncbi:hypothetical protein ACJX0J_018924 [Zea mays]
MHEAQKEHIKVLMFQNWRSIHFHHKDIHLGKKCTKMASCNQFSNWMEKIRTTQRRIFSWTTYALESKGKLDIEVKPKFSHSYTAIGAFRRAEGVYIDGFLLLLSRALIRYKSNEDSNKK